MSAWFYVCRSLLAILILVIVAPVQCALHSFFNSARRSLPFGVSVHCLICRARLRHDRSLLPVSACVGRSAFLPAPGSPRSLPVSVLVRGFHFPGAVLS